MKSYILLFSLPLLLAILVVCPYKANFYTLPSYLPIILSIFITIIFIYLFYKKPILGSKFITVLFLLGLLLRIIYLSDTPYDVRGYDFQGHIDYIEYVAKNHSLPSATTCWECYHPPVYYVAVSPVCELTSCNGNNLIILQLISLIADAGFLYFGIKLLRLFLPPGIGDKYFNLASALLIFWPSGIINSVRIGNDAFLYFFLSAGLYFITKWFLTGRAKDMWLSLGFLVVSVMTKSNGIIFLGIICFAALLRFIINKDRKELFHNSLKILLAIFIFALFFISFKFAQNYKDAKPKELLVNNITTLNSGLMVGNKINNYITFDIKEFLTVPYTDTWQDKGGRQYFLNFLLKSSLFGEFNFSQEILSPQAILMSYLLLFIVIIIILGILFVTFDFGKRYNKVPIYISSHLLIVPIILLFVSAIVCFRYMYPFSCSGDFRYIYPTVIPISAVAGYAVYILDKSWLAGVVEIIAYFFVIISIFFFMSLVIL